MKKILLLLSLLFSVSYGGGTAYAQECAVSLTGTYLLNPESGEGLYDAFVFDGAGKVGIHAFTGFKGDFFQIGDTVIVYPDKSLFVFLRKDAHTLVGISTWVKDQVFKRMENDTILTPAQSRHPEYAAQFYEFYTLTGRDEINLSTYLNIYMDSSLQASLKKLCGEGFPKACITLANALMLGSPELTASLRGTPVENRKAAPNKEIIDYFRKAIELNEPEAIAQLGAYFLMLGHRDKALKLFEIGCELGHSGCCFSLADLALEQEEN